MTKNLFLICVVLLICNCSFDKKSGFWTNESNIVELSEGKETVLFKKKIADDNEFNSQLSLIITNSYDNKHKYSGNNHGASNKKLSINNISKFKFKKINYFDQFEPEITFFGNDIIFFEKDGSILRFNDKSELIWKVNYYKKQEKKQNPLLKIYNYEEKILIIDNLYNYYLLDAISGELIWKKDHNTDFISQIKIDKDKFYVLDGNNEFICFSLFNGEKLWKFQSEERIINSAKENSVIFNNEKVIFLNSKGELVALDKINGNLIWMTPTIPYNESFQSYLINFSNLVLNDGNIYFSNNKNNFFSISEKTGIINWTHPISSSIKPIIVDELIFAISQNNYLYLIEKKTGNIIRSTDVFYNLKKRKKEKILIKGYVLDTKNIYATTNNGKIIVINIQKGRMISSYKISRGNLSKPYVSDDSLYLIKSNQILRLN
ncbi:hypothetical protein HIMB5_00009620 [alpha proteobacterium HIMB5]|nr:hypothetical protein HIMB5_00009620 [alpha proteobacterium HIMB5]